jgi:hypothetical protein
VLILVILPFEWNNLIYLIFSATHILQETKTVGAEVNWGVRFNENKDVCPFSILVLFIMLHAVPFQV